MTLSRTSTPLFRRFLSFLLPTVLAAAAMQLSFIAAGIFVGNMLGADSLAAMNLAMPFIQIFSAGGVFFGVGGTVLVALYKGAQQEREASEIFYLSFWGMILTGIAITICGVLGHKWLVTILAGTEPQLAQLLSLYLFPMFFAAPVFIFISGMVYFIRTDGRVTLAAGLLIFANGLNLIFIPLLIWQLGNLAAPAWGMVAGYSCATLGVFLYFTSPRRTLKLLKPRKFSKNLGKLFINGIPVAAIGLQFPIKLFFTNSVIVAYGGTAGLAAYSVVFACVLVISLCISGVVQTMMPMVGMLYGEKDWRGVRLVFGYSFYTLVISSLVLFALLEIFPGTVISWFGIIEPEMYQIGVTAIQISTLSLPGIALAALLRSYAQALGYPLTALWIVTVGNLLVALPALWILAAFFGLPGIWWSMVVAEYAAILPYFILMISISRQTHGARRGILLLPREENI